MTDGHYRRKLIESALPLDEINAACKAEKAVATGTVRNLHKWFAPMPLPAWRALLYAALIDDPGDDAARAQHLEIIKRLVANGAELPDDAVLEEARERIAMQFPSGLPTVFDPFCGGGSTLIEAQRLGLPTRGSDLNPVPTVITRTLTQVLPAVFDQAPLHSLADRDSRSRTLSQSALFGQQESSQALDGLASDVLFYAERVRSRASSLLEHAFPARPHGVEPVAWYWARTAPCPNPACGIETVLTTSWWACKKAGELAWIEPTVTDGRVSLEVVSGQASGEAPESPKLAGGVAFRCLSCEQPLKGDYLQGVGRARGLGLQMTCVVEQRGKQRIYRTPTDDDLNFAAAVTPPTIAEIPLGPANQYMAPPRYGMHFWHELFTARQQLVLGTIADLVAEVHDEVRADGGSEEWAVAVATVLGLAVGQLARYCSMLTFLFTRNGPSAAKAGFSRNDVPITWDFVETATLGDSIGGWVTVVKNSLRGVDFVARGTGTVERRDAREAVLSGPTLCATDPPYFDAIPYADLSDFFYLWHRRAMGRLYPDLYQTVASPKMGELTAFAGHHGGDKEVARQYFIEGFTQVFGRLSQPHEDDEYSLPLLVVYASKEQKAGHEEETRWSSILTAMINAELEITGTWPIHGTTAVRMMSAGSNAVATYVVMSCRPRPETAGSCSLADFNRALRRELKTAVKELQAAGILPVDLAQAAMGPGMQVYSRYRAVVDQSGRRVPVDQALRLINAALGEVLDEQEGELDPDSRFAVTWWEKHAWEAASFGEADQLARPQGLAVDDVVRAGVATYPRPGFVGLLGQGDLDRSWVPSGDARPTAWEAVHHLADRLIDGGGETDAARLMGQLGVYRDPAQALVYRLHDIAARKGRSKDQERYNALIGSWSDLLAIAATERDGLF